MTFPEQSQPSYGSPTPAKRGNKQLFIGLAAGALVGIVLGCCGGVAIGMNSSKSEPISAAEASAPASEAPASSAPTTPAAAQSTSSAPAAPAAIPTTMETDVIVMPDVVGQNAAVAADQLRELGFTRIQYGSQDKDATVVLLASNWTVTKQSAEAGSQVSADTLIVLTCTKQG